MFGGSYPDKVAGAVLFDPSVQEYVPAGERERLDTIREVLAKAT